MAFITVVMRHNTDLRHAWSKGKLSISLNVIVLLIGIDDLVRFCADGSVLDDELVAVDVFLEYHCLRNHAKFLLVLQLLSHF